MSSSRWLLGTDKAAYTILTNSNFICPTAQANAEAGDTLSLDTNGPNISTESKMLIDFLVTVEVMQWAGCDSGRSGGKNIFTRSPAPSACVFHFLTGGEYRIREDNTIPIQPYSIFLCSLLTTSKF